MNKVDQSYNIYQQKAIQTLKILYQKYPYEILIQSLFSKTYEGDIEKDIYKKLNELKKYVSLEDLSSFLYNIINGETYDTIIFSSELPSPLRVNQDLNETEENEKIDEESEKTNKKNIIRIKLGEENETLYEKKSNNKNKRTEIFNTKKNVIISNDILLNKPITKLQKSNNLEITRINNEQKEIRQKNNNKILSNSLEFTSISHKNQIKSYNNLLKKLSNTQNLTYTEFTKFYRIRKKLNKLMRKKSCKKIRENIYGLGIIGKHYTKNKKGEIFCYKPKCIKKGKIIEFICSEGDKCGSFGYYNILTKKFMIKAGHKMDFIKHKINIVKDRYFVKKLMKNEKLFDIQEYIKFTNYE